MTARRNLLPGHAVFVPGTHDRHGKGETLPSLVRSRAPWARIGVVGNAFGTFDVVLRIDGSYVTEAYAMAEAQALAASLTPPPEALDWFATDPKDPAPTEEPVTARTEETKP